MFSIFGSFRGLDFPDIKRIVAIRGTSIKKTKKQTFQNARRGLFRKGVVRSSTWKPREPENHKKHETQFEKKQTLKIL